MHSLELNKTYTVSEYFAIEESGDKRHEFIDGNLIEMSGASREHHRICKKLLRLFEDLLEDSGFETFMENMKLKIANENRYFYPDIFITREEQTDENKYLQFQPELIVEVLSEATRVRDMTDKFIDYRKIPSLQYYMLVEPEKTLVLLNYKNKEGEWEMNSYTRIDETVNLPEFNISFSLREIYQNMPSQG